MKKKPDAVARELGARVVGSVPRGDGAFGAARLAKVMAKRLAPSAGKRPGRPTNAAWSRHPKVPMSDETMSTLKALAIQLSSTERRVSPMQVAAQLLEDSVSRLAGSTNG